MKTQRKQLEFHIDILRTWNRFLLTSANSEKNLIHLYSLVMQRNISKYSDLPVDSLPIYFSDITKECHRQLTSDDLTDYLLRRSFEDIFNGFIYCLEDIYFFAEAKRIQKTNEKVPFKTREEAENKVKEIRQKAQKAFFGAILKSIEADLDIVPKFKEEIESLNTLRIIFTHSNGVVSDLDCDEQQQNEFVLKYLGMDVFVTNQSQKVRVNLENKKRLDSSTEIQFSILPKELRYKSETTVKMDFNLWNDFRVTLAGFLSNLIHDLPIPQELKNAIPKSLEAHIAYH